ncbi:MAG: flagellar assembly peptidoglycan hydrolase FlgJ [Betaproteobacteria bacterium]|nr:flagellar assembly peptidoglycan hydrolase FlgJ [Betaproteobacteria bacterium]
MAIGNDPAAIALAGGTQGVDALRLKARTDPKGAVKETARQFEALLMNVMLKSMRETVAQDGLFDSEQTRLYTSMLDQQLSQSMAKRGIGITEVLARQLTPAAQAAATDAAAPTAKPGVSPSSLQGTPPSLAPAQNPASTSQDAKSQARMFIERLAPDAEAVSRDTGIPVRFLLGHAALESGWGRAEIRAADGTPSHNLFGIKAGAGWPGRTVEVQTTEYAGGVAQKKVETFRAYDSYRDSLRDYANLLATSPRYAEVLKNTNDARAYARELQDAGYATDPRYADKLAGVIDGKFLRLV